MTSTDKNLPLAPWETIQHSSWDVSFVSSGYETPLWVLGITLTSYLSSPGLFLHPQNKFHSVISSPLWKPSFIRAYFPCDRKTDPFCPIQSTVPPPFLRPVSFLKPITPLQIGLLCVCFRVEREQLSISCLSLIPARIRSCLRTPSHPSPFYKRLDSKDTKEH